MDRIETCPLCREPIDSVGADNSDTYFVHCECGGRYRIAFEDAVAYLDIPRKDAALASEFARARYERGEEAPTFDFGLGGGSIPGAFTMADVRAWDAHRRPSEGDEGKRVWVWELPGHHRSQIRTGVLASWDESDLKMKDGKMFPWATISDWGIGDPPETTDA